MINRKEVLQTPLEKFYQWEKTRPNKIFLNQPHNGIWSSYTWKEAGNQIRTMANFLRKLNLPKESRVAILSKNCAHWILADLAIWMSGHISVPLYPNLLPKNYRDILNHSGSTVCFLGKIDDISNLETELPQNIQYITFPYGSVSYALKWNEIIKNNSPIEDSPGPQLKKTATIIYTSGTTGDPKGVVHNYKAMAFAGTNGIKALKITSHERFFSYLPLSHVAERLLIETASLYCGGEVYFAESLETFKQDIKKASPTIFLAVPRIWQKIQINILEKIPEKKLKLFLSIPLLSTYIKRKILNQLGLGNVRLAFTGTAPISPSLLQWYSEIGPDIFEAYAMTENFGYSHLNYRPFFKKGTVGRPMPGTQVKIDQNEEILIKNESIMEGYYKNPKATAKVLENGFLRTGDQGKIDKDHYLQITGRTKDLFKTSKGKYVAPAPIENKLHKNHCVEQVCVVGSGMPAPIALITLSDKGRKLPKNGLNQELDLLLKITNNTLDKHEKIGQIVVVKDDWAIKNGILTPTLKVKRRVIEEKYGPSLERWQKDPSTTILCS